MKKRLQKNNINSFKLKLFLVVLISSILFNCENKKDSDNKISETEKNCVVTEIDMGGSVNYKYFNNANGLYQIREEIGSIQNLYVSHIANDSIEIGFILSDLTNDLPVIKAKYDNQGQLIKLERDYLNSKSNIFTFEYTTDKINVIQLYNNSGDIRKVAYGEYYLDENMNVVLVKKYRQNINDPLIFDLSEEKMFTYDNANNPWKGILYPNFLFQGLPCSNFFSSNNISQITKDGITANFEYQYNDNVTIRRFVPDEPFGITCGLNYDENYFYSNCIN